MQCLPDAPDRWHAPLADPDAQGRWLCFAKR
jgi:hypothetical protein